MGNATSEVLVKEVAGNEELITIAAPAGQQVDGQTEVQIAGPNSGRWLVSDGGS